MSTSRDDGYICSLDAATEKKAHEELNEDPKQRLSAAHALREWVQTQPHLNCNLETRMMLTFLRSAKFSQLKARQKLEGMMTAYTHIPEWFQNVDTTSKNMLKVIDAGYVIPLPKKDHNGSHILLYRLGALDPSTKKIPLADEIRMASIAGSYCSQRDEGVEVNGFVFIMDFTGYTAKHIGRWGLEDIKKWSKCWQNNMPGRFKAFHYYNAGTFFETVMAMARPFLSQKFQDRTKVHNSMESLYSHVPMELLPEDYLPDDYEGPNAGSLHDIIKNFRQEVTSDAFRKNMKELTSSKYGVDFSKKPKNDVPQSSFRKLNLD